MGPTGSTMTMAGNLLMTPILIGFIFISTLIMGTELCMIPNSLLYAALEKLTGIWLGILKLGKTSWLVPLSWNLTVCLVVSSGIAGFFTYRHKPKLLALALLVPFLMFGLPSRILERIAAPYGKTAILEKRRGKLFVQHDHKNRLSIRDDRFFSQCGSANSAVIFDIKPQLAQQFGTFHIKTLKLGTISTRTVRMAEALCRYCCIEIIQFDPASCKKYDKPRSQASFDRAWVQLAFMALATQTTIETKKAPTSHRR
jgi:hypothetical protein